MDSQRKSIGHKTGLILEGELSKRSLDYSTALRKPWQGARAPSGVGGEWWPKQGDIKGRLDRDHGRRRLGEG